MTYYTLTLSDLATSTLDDLATMEMGRPPIYTPWHCDFLASAPQKWNTELFIHEA